MMEIQLFGAAFFVSQSGYSKCFDNPEKAFSWPRVSTNLSDYTKAWNSIKNDSGRFVKNQMQWPPY